jgi:ankyrin repeat protein
MTWLLLDQGIDANVQKCNFWSPLHLASTQGHFKVAELLVHRGARVDVFTGMQETPLHLAAGNGRVEIVCLLIDHRVNLDTSNSNGWTPLHAASQHGHLELDPVYLIDAVNELQY